MQVRRAVEILILIGLTLWTFWGCLANPFHFDDELILHSPQVTHPGDPISLVQWSQLRQLTYLSFFLNYYLGGTEPSGYHLFNLLIHIANVLGMYVLAWLLIRRDEHSNFESRVLPFAAASIFALHPIQSEAVNYVYQRSAPLAAFFVIGALCAFLWAQRFRDFHPVGWLVVPFFVLALAGKESALILPLVLVAYLWVHARDGLAFKTSLRRIRWLLISLGIMMLAGGGWALYFLLRQGERTAGLGVTKITPFEYLTSQIHVIVAYLRLVIWPAGLSADHDVPLVSWSSPSTWLSLLLLAGLLAFAFWLRKRAPMASFLILGFFIFLAPTSSLVPSADLMFEHRLYLPMIAASALLALGFLYLTRLLVKSPRKQEFAALALVGLVVAGYSLASKERTFIWGSNTRLWKDAVAKAPGKARAHYNLAVSYLKSDRDKARREFIAAQELRPGHAPTLYNLGWIEQTRAAYDSARTYYRLTLQADPTHWEAHHNLGNIEVLRGCFQEAMIDFSHAARLRGDYWPAYLSLGTLQLQQEQVREARATFEILKVLRPDLLEGRYLLACALIEDGSFPLAEAELRFISSKDLDGNYKERIEELRHRISTVQRPTSDD
jgi:tetratricopeptide (TPR) repeat protein